MRNRLEGAGTDGRIRTNVLWFFVCDIDILDLNGLELGLARGYCKHSIGFSGSL